MLPVLACEHPLSTQHHPNNAMGSLPVTAKEISFFFEYLAFVIVSRDSLVLRHQVQIFSASLLCLLEVSTCQSSQTSENTSRQR